MGQRSLYVRRGARAADDSELLQARPALEHQLAWMCGHYRMQRLADPVVLLDSERKHIEALRSSNDRAAEHLGVCLTPQR